LLGNGYRAYNPRLMRFHSPDSWSPFGAGGLNPYAYCGGNPVFNKDPTGHVFLPVLDDLIQGIANGARSLGMRARGAVNRIQDTIAQPSMRVNPSSQGLASTSMNGPGPGGPYTWPSNPPLTPGPSSAPYPTPKPPVSKMNGPGPGGPYTWPSNPPLTPGPSSAPYPTPKPPVSKMNGPGPGGPYTWPSNPPLTPGPSSAPYPTPKPPVPKNNSGLLDEKGIFKVQNLLSRAVEKTTEIRSSSTLRQTNSL
jgi:hypothetical protein